MGQQTVNIGNAANDGTGDALRTAFSKVVDNFEELYALQSSTINAGSVDYAGLATVELRIQAAINDAVALGADRVFVPGNMFPYTASSVTFSSTVQMVREGGNWSVHDVYAYGAAGDAVQDDTVAIQSAITAASVNPNLAKEGGVVFFPPGAYLVTASLVVPVALDENQVILRGSGMRVSYLFPSGNTAFANGVVRFGTATPDASGTTTNVTQYTGMEDMSINGSFLTAGTNTAVQFTEMQKGWLQNVIIEEFDTGSSIGLYLRGSTGASSPHVWRCNFTNVLVATTKRPLVLENADENDFYNCNFACVSGESTATYAVDVLQGRNNRWFGLLIGGDTNGAFRSNYRGLNFRTPSVGDNSGNQVYGFVAEGFKYGVYIESSVVADIVVLGYNSSINEFDFWDGADNGDGGTERQHRVHIEVQGSSHRHYLTSRTPTGPPLSLAINDTTPSVAGSNAFAFINTLPTTVTALDDGLSGQVVVIRMDTNTTLQHGTGADQIRCPGAVNLVGAAQKMVTLVRLGGQWYVTAVSTDA